MRIALAVALLAALAAPAHAHPAYDYLGGCGLEMSGEGAKSLQIGLQGDLHAAVVATESTTGTPVAVPVHVECALRVGTTTRAAVAASGAGVAAGVVTFAFQADPDEVFIFCETVTVAGEAHQRCDEVTPTPLVPESVMDEGWMIVDWIVFHQCSTLYQQSGGPFDQPPVFDIRSDGDIYVLGDQLVDCVPYGTSGD